jgi:hypothetical protein
MDLRPFVSGSMPGCSARASAKHPGTVVAKAAHLASCRARISRGKILAPTVPTFRLWLPLRRCSRLHRSPANQVVAVVEVVRALTSDHLRIGRYRVLDGHAEHGRPSSKVAQVVGVEFHGVDARGGGEMYRITGFEAPPARTPLPEIPLM